MADPSTPIWKRRWFLVLGGTFALLVLLVAFVLPGLLDVERYRPHIEQALFDATGWDPDVGEIDVSLFPRMSVHVGASSLASPRTESSIAIGSLDIAASFWPLLQGALAIEHVTLDSPRITLVRQAGDSGWDIPTPPPDGTAVPDRQREDQDIELPDPESARPTGEAADEDGEKAGAVIDVAVERIVIRNGALRIEDRSVDPPRTLTVDPFALNAFPVRGTFDGSARLAPDGGSLSWEGTFDDGLTLTLDDLVTDRLAAIVGSDLLQPGGTLSGAVDVTFPFTAAGTLAGRNLALTTAEQPIANADLHFRVIPDDAGLLLETARLSLGELHVDCAGRLTPALDLAVQIPSAPLESALEAVRGLVHFPLDLEGPGTAEIAIKVFQDEAATIRYSATGQLSAHRLIGADFLPSADDVKTTFDLTEAGRLTVHIAQGNVAGGPMRGKIVLDRVDPPGTLRFDGTLRGASLGGLLAGFVEGAAEKIVGPTSVQAALTLDLAREVVDARAVAGTVKLTTGKITLPGWDIEGKLESDLATRLSALNLTSLLDKDKLAKLGSSDVPVAFDALRANLQLDAVPWTLDSLRLSRDGGALNGAGSFDPLTGMIAVELDVELSTRRSAELVEKHRSLEMLLGDDGHIRLPLGLRGAIDHPEIEVNLGDLALDVLGSDAGKKDLLNKLKSLFDNDDD